MGTKRDALLGMTASELRYGVEVVGRYNEASFIEDRNIADVVVEIADDFLVGEIGKLHFKRGLTFRGDWQASGLITRIWSAAEMCEPAEHMESGIETAILIEPRLRPGLRRMETPEGAGSGVERDRRTQPAAKWAKKPRAHAAPSRPR